ncbi:probable tocopherol cyclase, chloroplastic isoform X1 [Amborella trichopoda]|nr:probable tocopherol cyclase, chloroplastic isoform X1 [Amborella trichopoda]|eukprot:XP_020518284.1 probable tocopherol cyclase, chloroplastic isoform X1 [Amborella trichopoda]
MIFLAPASIQAVIANRKTHMLSLSATINSGEMVASLAWSSMFSRGCALPVNIGFCNRGKDSNTHLSSNCERKRNSAVLVRARTNAPVMPEYEHTPANRELRTPHSGYHFDGSARRFFEGWYFKVSIPEQKQSFCFMYSVEDPAFSGKLGKFDEAVYGSRFTGVGAQILGAHEKYICQFSEESNNFWGDRHELTLGNTFLAREAVSAPNGEVSPQEFQKCVLEGFQVTPIWHQGFIRDDGRSPYVQTVKSARWEYSTRPIYGWGDVGSNQKSTASWPAALPVFEPHWQVCMAGGLSTGWIEWDGEQFEFEDAPSYSEKNWGGAFPKKWFWVQCNVFEGVTGEVALTAAGGTRKLVGLTETFEDVALIGVHYDGKFYEFVPWTSTVKWKIAPWGYWYMSGENDSYKVELEATTKSDGTVLRAPTIEGGLIPYCRDTCSGDLKLRLWERRYDGTEGKLILDVTSDMAALETGGGPWYDTWKTTSASPPLVGQILRFPIDVDAIFKPIPFLKPPGL